MKEMLKNILVNSSPIKKGLKALLMSSFHLIVFVAIHEIGVRLFPLVFDITKRSNLNWGITVQFSLVVFGVLSLAMSLLCEWIEKQKYQYLILICVCLIFLGIFIGNTKYTPYRTLLLLLSGLLGFILPVFIRRKWVYVPQNTK